MSDFNIYTYFHRTAQTYPDHIALHVDDVDYSYRELEDRVDRISKILAGDKRPFIGLFARKSVTAYSALLAILKAGKAYVPFNPEIPAARNGKILETADIATLVADSNYLEQLDGLLKICSHGKTLILPDASGDLSEKIDLDGHHKLVFSGHSDLMKAAERVNIQKPGRYAYLLFTSGSTGEPKGVPVSHQNFYSYMEHVNRIHDYHERDRFSQAFELTFDPSVQDIFSAWSNGAALYSVPDKYRFIPARFISGNELSVWHSVPSIPRIMNMYGLIKPHSFSSLRYSQFGGEPLHADLARLWSTAAPNSVIDNVYGPTEVTITISQYRWNPAQTPEIKSYSGIVSVGRIYPGHDGKLLSANGRDEDETGELILSGSQVVDSYYRNEEATGENFIRLEGDGGRSWYRTGDIMKIDSDGDLYFLGRVDDQIKINGNRVEPGEINHIIESLTGSQTAVTLPYPYGSGITEKIVIFIVSRVKETDQEILQFSRGRLPDYMVPHAICRVENFPLNRNGKIDNAKLMEIYEEQEPAPKRSQIQDKKTSGQQDTRDMYQKETDNRENSAE